MKDLRVEVGGDMERKELVKKRIDFSNAKKNPYAKRLKKQVTIRIDEETLTYFKGLAEDVDIPYQTLINFYLKDCAVQGKRLRMGWKRQGKAA